MRYSIEPKGRIHIKGYGFLSSAKNMDNNLSNKYGQKLLDSDKYQKKYQKKDTCLQKKGNKLLMN